MRISSRARTIAPVFLLLFLSEARAGGPEVVVTSDLTGDGIPELVLAGMPTRVLREDLFWLVDGATGEPLERLELGLRFLLGKTSLLGGFDADGDGHEDLAVIGAVLSESSWTNPGSRRAELVTYSPFLRAEIERWAVPWEEGLFRRSGLYKVTACATDRKVMIHTFSTDGLRWLAFRSGERALDERSPVAWESSACKADLGRRLYRAPTGRSIDIQIGGRTRIWSVQVSDQSTRCVLLAREETSCEPVHRVEFALREEIDHARIFRVGDWDRDGVRDLAVSIFSVSSDNNELMDAEITVHSAGLSGEVLARVPVQNTLGHLSWWPLDGGYDVAGEADIDGDDVFDLIAITHEWGVMRSIESDGVQYETPSGVTAYSGKSGEVLWVLSEHQLY